MKREKISIEYEVYAAAGMLPEKDQLLLEAAFKATGHAYAPYSRFYVAAAVYGPEGEILTGTNQENVSFPVGICAERVLLSALSCSANLPSVQTMAIGYTSPRVASNQPLCPCGMCRQALAEYEQRQQAPIRLVLGGATGPVHVFATVRDLLPFAFEAEALTQSFEP